MDTEYVTFFSGLSQLDSTDAEDLAFHLAQQWIRTNWLTYVKYDAMFEKVRYLFLILEIFHNIYTCMCVYVFITHTHTRTCLLAVCLFQYDVSGDGKPGGGGEYEVQVLML